MEGGLDVFRDVMAVVPHGAGRRRNEAGQAPGGAGSAGGRGPDDRRARPGLPANEASFRPAFAVADRDLVGHDVAADRLGQRPLLFRAWQFEHGEDAAVTKRPARAIALLMKPMMKIGDDEGEIAVEGGKARPPSCRPRSPDGRRRRDDDGRHARDEGDNRDDAGKHAQDLEADVLGLGIHRLEFVPGPLRVQNTDEGRAEDAFVDGLLSRSTTR